MGDYINRELLDELAHKTKGKSHFVENPDAIPQIINAEVGSHEDLAIQEHPVRAVRVRPVEFTDGIDFTKAPRLLGFVQAEAKEGTETILRVDDEKPLLVRWHYGLGRVDRVYVRREEPLGRAVGSLGIVRYAVAANGAGCFSSRPRCSCRSPTRN